MSDEYLEKLGISEETLDKLYESKEFQNIIKKLEANNPRFKQLPEANKKLAMAMFLKGDINKIEGMWHLFYKRPIPSIEEFLHKDYIGSDANFYTPDSPWTRDLKEIFAPTSNIYEFCATGAIGCVDKDTEFLTEIGWKKISEYQEGDKVAAYIPGTDTIQWETPKAYVKYPEKEMTLVQCKGVDMCLSEEHKVVYWPSKKSKEPKIIPFSEVRKRHNKSNDGWQGKIKTTFKVDRPGLNISEGELRLQVAVIADGHVSKEGKDNYTTMRFSKDRKYTRLLDLCNKFNLKYEDRGWKPAKYESGKEYTVIVWPKWIDKKFDSKYWNCSQEQLEIIGDEVGHWDGSFYPTSKGNTIHYFSVYKSNADFVQYAFSSCGKNTSLSYDDRGEGKQCYIVRGNASGEGFRCIANKDKKLELVKYEPEDNYKYCFTVSSQIWVARRNNKIFITGNTAKSSTTRVAHFYNLYRITSLRFPQLALGAGETKPMALIFLTITKLKASESLEGMRTMLKQSKYFTKVEKIEELDTYLGDPSIVPYVEHKVEGFERITFPSNVYISSGSQLQHTIGSDLFGASLDEAEFKKGPNAAKEAYDLYTELLSRVDSRFGDAKFKLVTLISSVKSDTGVISKHIENLKYKPDTAYLSSYAIWEIKEMYRGAFKKYGSFYVLRGTQAHPSRILTEKESKDYEKQLYICPENCKVVKVPNHPVLYSKFQENPDRALREQAGESTAGGERPFYSILSELEEPSFLPELTLKAEFTQKASLFDQLPVRELFLKTPEGLRLKRYPEAKRYCFTGDTKVKLLSGVNKSMEELVEDFNSGKSNWVYSWTKKGWKPGKIKSAHISKLTRNIIKITLDNDCEIKCTPNHKFMLKNGSYKEAKDLKENDSLMPCYTAFNKEGYEYIIDNKGSKVLTHKISDNLIDKEELNEGDKYYIRHHRDFNKLNNNPENLVFMGNSSHSKLHIKHAESFGFKNQWKCRNFRRKMSEVNSRNGKINGTKNMTKNWHGPDNKKWREKLKPSQKKTGSRNLTNYNNSRFNNSNSEINNKNRQWAADNLSKIKAKPELKEKLRKQNKILGRQTALKTNSDPNHINSRVLGKIKKFGKKLISLNLSINQETWDSKELRKNTTAIPKWEKTIERLGSEEELNKILYFNHKVKNIEVITLKEEVPVYDLTIEDETNSHNFVLSSGVVVSNCHLDLADTGEAGIAMCHKEVTTEGKIMYVFDFVSKVISPNRLSQTLIEEFLVDLKEIGNIKLEILSADQYQSTYMRERLENLHKVAKYVKKTAIGGKSSIEPFLTCASLISEGSVKVGKCTELKEQLQGIYIDNEYLQYDTIRKDMVDTFIGTLYICLNSSLDIPTHIYRVFNKEEDIIDLTKIEGIKEL